MRTHTLALATGLLAVLATASTPAASAGPDSRVPGAARPHVPVVLAGRPLAVGDIDADGADDLVVDAAAGPARGRRLEVRYGRPEQAGSAPAPGEVLLPTGGGAPAPAVAISLADVNRDGAADLVAGLAGAGRGERPAIAVVLGGARWSSRTLSRARGADLWLTMPDAPAASAAPLAVHWGDLDGDGVADVLARTAAESSVVAAVMLGAGALRGAHAFRPDVTLLGLDGCPVAVAGLADVTGDGLDDLVGAVCRAGRHGHLVAVAGRVNWPAVVDVRQASAWAVRTDGWYRGSTGEGRIALADADGDGAMDIFAEGEGAVYVWSGGRDLARRSSVSRARWIVRGARLGVAGDPRLWRPGDLDGDGRVDLLLRDAARGTYRSLAVDAGSPGVLDVGEAPAVAGWPAAEAWALGDLDGDGHLDALLAEGDSGAGRLGFGPFAVAGGASRVGTGGREGFDVPASHVAACNVGLDGFLEEAAGVPDQAYPGGKAVIFLPIGLADDAPIRPTALPPATATQTEGPPTATTGPSATPSPSPMPTASPTLPADLRQITFPPIGPAGLGSCSAEAHDRFAVEGPDGQTYRTWHPVTVPVDPADPAGAACSFGHEHGVDPIQGRFTQMPPFGYTSRITGDVAMILAHAGFKVLYHPEERDGTGTWAEWRISFHQGTAGVGRLTIPPHEVQWEIFERHDHRPDEDLEHVHETVVRVQGDTGRLNPKCGPRVGDRIVPDLDCAKQHQLYEVWYTTIMVGAGDARGAAFFAAPGIVTENAMTYMDPADASKVFATSVLIEEGLPRGDPRSRYLGNRHAIEHPDFGWGNTGPEEFWTDGFGNALDPEAEAACTPLTCVRQRLPSGYHRIVDDDYVFSWPEIELPLGALGGN